MTRVLLVSTYELGTEPLGIIGPAADLAASGHEVRCCDLSVTEWPDVDLEWADCVAFSVPMHTALRLGLAALARLRATYPSIPVAFYGMYGPVAKTTSALGEGDLVTDGRDRAALASWVGDIDGGARPDAPVRATDRATDRASDGTNDPAGDRAATLGAIGVPALDRYARLVTADGEHLVGTVESTIGCSHRCRHCPVPTVYDGRSTAVELTAIVAAIDARVRAGARHIHFADPDFLNRPAHARRVAGELHRLHPTVTFDATIKVSHILRHRGLFPEFAAAGLLFCVSAFESTSPVVLERLDKGHTAAEALLAVDVLRAAGIEPRPSLLPFTPWTTRADVVELLDFVARTDCVANIDPVHYSIRLLVPPGSLLLDLDDPVLDDALGPYDPAELGFPWRSSDPVLDDLQRELARRIELAATDGLDTDAAYDMVRSCVFAAFGDTDPGRPAPETALGPPARFRPRLSETWFCCAEPTAAQLGSVADDVCRTPAVDNGPTPVHLRGPRTAAALPTR